MGVFNFMETSFIISLGITFVLILLLIYHFKQRLTASESKQDTMFEIINNLAQELNNVKGHLGQLTMMSRPSTPYPFNTANSNITFTHEKIAQNDEPDEESTEEDEYDSDDEERIIVSDDEEDDISVEELSDDEEDDDEDSQNQSIEVEDVEMKIAEKENSEETIEPIKKEEKEPVNFSKMNLGSLKAYIVEKGLVEDASKMKKAQILTLIQEQQPAI
jgi:outer membrane biosynthesis protein TonB